MVTNTKPGGNHKADNRQWRLSAENYEELHEASGLSDDQIKACGFYTETDPRAIGKLLNWNGPADCLGACLVIPYGSGFCRLKTSTPRKDKSTGKACKYESPFEQPIRPYFPPRTAPVLRNPEAPLLITEGEKKAAKADQEGYACVALAGV